MVLNVKHKHHKIPKSRGGSDEPWNLVDLSEYDHALGHALDFVLFEEAPWFDARHSGWTLLPEDLREAVLKEMSRRTTIRNSGKSLDPATKEKISNSLKGRVFPEIYTPERSQKISDTLTGKAKSLSHKENISKARKEKGLAKGKNNPMFGRSAHKGKKWWVNEENETHYGYESPGPGWVRGRKWHLR